jgi:hypothetical protein
MTQAECGIDDFANEGSVEKMNSFRDFPAAAIM